MRGYRNKASQSLSNSARAHDGSQPRSRRGLSAELMTVDARCESLYPMWTGLGAARGRTSRWVRVGASWPCWPTSRAWTSLPPSIGCAGGGFSTPTARRARRRLPCSPNRTATAATMPAGCGIGRLKYLSTPATSRACGWRKITAGGQPYRWARPSGGSPPQRGHTRAR